MELAVVLSGQMPRKHGKSDCRGSRAGHGHWRVDLKPGPEHRRARGRSMPQDGFFRVRSSQKLR